MIEIIKDRGCGKTQTLIELSEEKQMPIIVHSRTAYHLIKKQAMELGKKIPEPIVCNKNMCEQMNSKKLTDVLVDDLELCEGITLYSAPVSVYGYTANTFSVLSLRTQCDKKDKQISNLQAELDDMKHKYSALLEDYWELLYGRE